MNSQPSLLKYVIVQRDGREFPIIFDTDGHISVSYIGSDSLNLKPRLAQDRAILTTTLNLSPTPTSHQSHTSH